MMGQCASATDTMNNSIFVSLLPSTCYILSFCKKKEVMTPTLLTM